jgi:hypothetical protein
MTKLLTIAAVLIALCTPAVAGSDEQVTCARELIKVEHQAKKLKISYGDIFGVCADPDYGKRVIAALEKCIKTRQTNCTWPSN